jgi:class 3 adenylate cyclase
MTTLRTQLQIQRINTMRRRRAEALARLRTEDCQCLRCQLRRGVASGEASAGAGSSFGGFALADLLSRLAGEEPDQADAIAPDKAH